MAGQLGPQSGLDHPAGQLRQQPARARDLLRLEALERLLERPGGQQLGQTIGLPLGEHLTNRLLPLAGQGCPLPARRPDRSPRRPPGYAAPDRDVRPQYRSPRPHTEHRTDPAAAGGSTGRSSHLDIASATKRLRACSAPRRVLAQLSTSSARALVIAT